MNIVFRILIFLVVASGFSAPAFSQAGLSSQEYQAAAADFKTHGFTFVILYDKASAKTAGKLKRALEFQKPFSQLRGWFHVKKELIIDEMLKCRDAGMSDARVVVCDNQKELLNYGKTFGADHVLVLTSKGVGGSGGLVAVFSTSGDRYQKGQWQKGVYHKGSRLVTGSVHEFLHQIGFVDEYNYDEPSFQKTFCRPATLKNKTNVIYEDFSKLKFTSDEQAHAYLDGKIPWLKLVPRSVPILTNGQVGTPLKTFKRGTLGLFRGGGCNEVTPGWVPYEITLMEELWGRLSKLMPPYFVTEVRNALINDAFQQSVERVTSKKDSARRDGNSAR